MYYDSLMKRARRYAENRRTITQAVDIHNLIAPVYYPLHDDMAAAAHRFYYLPGGRGSAKSSFAALEVVNGVMNDPTASAVVFRRVANTLRESVFAQIAWAIDALGVTDLWEPTVSPMAYTLKATGQQIIFKGLDDALKLKSIKPRRGLFKYVWFEEFSELLGPNQFRSVLQSVVRGGEGFKVLCTFNPPLSLNAWANRYIEEPDTRAIILRTDYTMIPPEWLGDAFLDEADRLRELNPKAFEHEYLGKPTGTGGEVFPNLEIRTITDDEIEQAGYRFTGCDFGFASDPAVCMLVSYDHKHETIMLHDEIYRIHCSNSELAQAIYDKRFDCIGGEWLGYNSQIICDCSEPKSIHDLRDAGIEAAACRKYAGSVLYGIKWLQRRRIIIDPARTPHAYKEFVGYQYETTKDGEFTAAVPDKDNHTIDAVRYSLDRLINSREASA